MTRPLTALLGTLALVGIMLVIYALIDSPTVPAPRVTKEEHAACMKNARGGLAFLRYYPVGRDDNGRTYFDLGRCVDKPPGEICGRRFCR